MRNTTIVFLMIILKMVGSMDYLDFCPEIPVTEKNAIPLDCWHEIKLSDIWIPSHLLPNRSKPSNMKVPRGIYHTLEKKDSSKYAKSFSVYSFDSTENGQGEIFISDSDDDIFGDSISFEKIQISDNTLPAVANHMYPLSSVCSNYLKNSTETNILNKNTEEGKRHLNSKENLVDNGRNSPCLDEICQEENIKMIMSSNENLINMRNKQQNDISLSNGIHTGSQKHFADIKENHGVVKTGGFEDRLNKNIDLISLKDILDNTPEINIKDPSFVFKKKDYPFLLSLYDKKEKKVKKNKKDKVKKKASKYIVLDNFLETNTEINQDYYCDKYFQSILNDKPKDASCSNVHVGSNIEFPQLASNEYMFAKSDKREKEASCSNVHVGSNMEFPHLASDQHMFVQSDKREKENIESTFNDLECGLIKSEEINENITAVKEIKPYITDATCGKIVIENIPYETTKDDILAILCGYGEIKKFSLVSTGHFFTAYVEIDLICDIDWIIECLNGSEPFGASTEKIYCYKQ